MSSVRAAALAAFVVSASLWGAFAQAQVYRIVGPDGKVTFSDRPPAEARSGPAAGAAPAAGGAGGVTLPLELRNAVGRYPVTLYTGRECAPCDMARSFLVRRGVPFTEKTVNSADDIAALERVSGAPRLPFATLGAQHLKGFSESEWNSYFDAAGYPKVSQLPPAYRNPAPTPLVAVQVAPAPAAPPQPQQPARAELDTPAETPSNPAGIRF